MPAALSAPPPPAAAAFTAPSLPPPPPPRATLLPPPAPPPLAFGSMQAQAVAQAAFVADLIDDDAFREGLLRLAGGGDGGAAMPMQWDEDSAFLGVGSPRLVAAAAAPAPLLPALATLPRAPATLLPPAAYLARGAPLPPLLGMHAPAGSLAEGLAYSCGVSAAAPLPCLVLPPAPCSVAALPGAATLPPLLPLPSGAFAPMHAWAPQPALTLQPQPLLAVPAQAEHASDAQEGAPGELLL
jgi:hypothetical protein